MVSCPHHWNTGFMSQWMKAVLTITLSDPLRESVYLVSTVLCSVGLEILIRKEKYLDQVTHQ